MTLAREQTSVEVTAFQSMCIDARDPESDVFERDLILLKAFRRAETLRKA